MTRPPDHRPPRLTPVHAGGRGEHQVVHRLPRRVATDPEAVQRDLVRLVLTVIELVRQLMERQAIRRVEGGGLSDDQVEQVGLALLRLEEAMTELRERFDLKPSDLNLDLGPLGPLLPIDQD